MNLKVDNWTIFMGFFMNCHWNWLNERVFFSRELRKKKQKSIVTLHNHNQKSEFTILLVKITTFLWMQIIAHWHWGIMFAAPSNCRLHFGLVVDFCICIRMKLRIVFIVCFCRVTSIQGRRHCDACATVLLVAYRENDIISSYKRCSCGQHCASFPYISSEHHQFNDFLPFFELVEIVISAQSNAQDFAAIFRYSTEKHT